MGIENKSIKYEILESPVPEDFHSWYPYIKKENMKGENPLWLPVLRNALRNKLAGMENIFFAVKDKGNKKWCGVAWCCRAKVLPELLHFGWFFVENEYRGHKIGSKIISLCKDWAKENKVKVIMLPTSINTEPAHSMYLHRGWKDTIIDQCNGYCFMIKASLNHYYDYFNCNGNLTINEIKVSDYICLDYLLNKKIYSSRLYPLGLVGSRRFISFETSWNNYITLVARENYKVLGIAVTKQEKNGMNIDICSPIKRVNEVLVKELLNKFRSKIYVTCAQSDKKKIKFFLDAGFKKRSEKEELVDGEKIKFISYYKNNV